MEFTEVNNVENLVTFIRERGPRHRNYYHYTNLDGALNIIRSRQWHLSLGDSMNDRQELTKGDQERWKRIYITSFAYGSGENMAMWGLYSLPWQESVRITIPQQAMQRWVSEGFVLHKATLDKGAYRYDEMDDAPFADSRLTDVAYISGSRGFRDGKLKWNDESIKLVDKPDLARISEDVQITGYLKNSAWAYENETRIRVEFPKEQRDIKKIAISVPEHVIDSLTITAGPWFQGDLLKVISEKLQLGIHTDESSFKNLVNFRNICSMCDHKSFVKIASNA